MSKWKRAFNQPDPSDFFELVNLVDLKSKGATDVDLFTFSKFKLRKNHKKINKKNWFRV